MLIALTALFFLVSVLLILVVLLQPGEGGGMGFLGGGSQSAFGAKTGNVMTRFTTLLAALFLIVSFTLGFINARQSKVETKELLDIKKTVEETPGAAPSERVGGEDIGVDISDTNE